MIEVKEWMALENDTGHPTIVLTDPKTGEIVAKPKISVFSKLPVGPVNLVAPVEEEGEGGLASRFYAQLRAEYLTIEEGFKAALEIDENASEPELLDQEAFEGVYLPAVPDLMLLRLPTDETPQDEKPPDEKPAPTIEIIEEPEKPVIRATEAAVRLAEESGIDLASIEGSGVEGAIIMEDVRKAIKEKNAE